MMSCINAMSLVGYQCRGSGSVSHLTTVHISSHGRRNQITGMPWSGIITLRRRFRAG